jgi:vacuolar-type H+-ATPase subunit C/Vma6
MTGLEYGNARIRARRASLLDSDAYALLVRSPDLGRLTGALGAGAYGADVEQAFARFEGVRLIDAVVGGHLERELAEVHSFYADATRDRLEVLMGRWDVANLVALVRAQAGRRGSMLNSSVLPTGRISRAVLDELAHQPGLRAMVELLVSWSVPTPAIRDRLRRSLPEFDRSGSPAVLEVAIEAGFADEVEAAAKEAPDRLSLQLLAELAAKAILVAARFRTAERAGEDPPSISLLSATGLVAPGIIETVIRAADASIASFPYGFGPAVAVWIGGGDLPRLEVDLERVLLHTAQRGYVIDPLGIGVPVGYLWLLEAEARNLRLIARYVDAGLDRTTLEGKLMVP